MDVWAYGCSVWQVATGSVFFHTVSRQNLGAVIDSYSVKYRGGMASASFRPWLARIQQCGKWQRLVQACLHPFPSKRPSNIEDVVSKASIDTAS